MIRVNYGTSAETAFELYPSRNLLAVRTFSRQPLGRSAVPPPAAATLSGAHLVLSFPEAGVEVFELPPETGSGMSLEQRKEALRGDSDIRFAGEVLVDSAGEPAVYTENLFLKFRDSIDPARAAQILADHGLVQKRRLSYAENAYFVAAPDDTGQAVFGIADELRALPEVEEVHPELLRRARGRAIHPGQWHLQTATINSTTVMAHANVAPAHELSKGEGVVIAIIDNGVDTDHPEFAAAGKLVARRDFSFPEDHPLARDPRPRDPFAGPKALQHGTACAGVACATGSAGASGVAPEAKLMPLRITDAVGSQQEADAIAWAADNGADVISCSWGPVEGHWSQPGNPLYNRVVLLPPSTRRALEHAVTRGRGGKGCVVLFAAGNGNESVDNDGYASSEHVIAVAACNDRGLRSVYSDYGKAIWCCFPSNDFAWPQDQHLAPLTAGIRTTDLSGLPGTESGDYTDRFGGTSSSCPGVAGVVALMLSANPALTRAQVKDLLAAACDPIDPRNGAYDGSGRSDLYGFGRINALTAVTLAARGSVPVGPTVGVGTPASPPLAPNQPTAGWSHYSPGNLPVALRDLQTVRTSVDVEEPGAIAELEVFVELEHNFIGDLVLTLIPPPQSPLPELTLQRRSGAGKRIRRWYTLADLPELARYQNAVCEGTWTLAVSDEQPEDEGMLIAFGLRWRRRDGAGSSVVTRGPIQGAFDVRSPGPVADPPRGAARRRSPQPERKTASPPLPRS
jgi:subtilisin family serine protease